MTDSFTQLRLFESKKKKGANGTAFSDPAFATNKVLPIHRWVPWIAGFASNFVDDALSIYLKGKRGVVLDPFSGVGTTLVEAMMAGHDTYGFEINPYAALACQTKLNARKVDPERLREVLELFKVFYKDALRSNSDPQSRPPAGFTTRAPFYSPNVMRKVLIVQDFINNLSDALIRDLFRIAFASTMVTYSNYSYEPSLGRRKSAGKEDILDYGVGEEIAGKLRDMLQDIEWVQSRLRVRDLTTRVINDSFFEYKAHLPSESVDLIVTSPPYVNNYHYNRNTRPHMYWLGFANKPKDLKPLEHQNFGTYWQTARGAQLIDLEFELPGSDLAETLQALREKNPEKGVYGGHGWANYASAYFNDCLKFSNGMMHVLKPGGTALVVIGPSILQGVFISTDVYLGEIAESVGLELVEIHIPRESRVGNSIIQSDVRVAKAADKDQLYEAVVEIRKP